MPTSSDAYDSELNAGKKHFVAAEYTIPVAKLTSNKIRENKTEMSLFTNFHI